MSKSLLWRSLAGGIISVVAFSLTAPATKVAVADFSPLAVTGIRGLIAGLFCLGFLLFKPGPTPAFATLKQLFLVSLIGAAGFSVFLSLGLQTVPSTHASVFLAILPLATAIFSQILLGERTSALFWTGALSGCAIAVGFMAYRSHGAVAIGDVFLFIAVAFAAWGYVRAAAFTRILGGARTMSWVVVLGSPVFLILLVLGRPDFSHAPSANSVVALLYLGMISQSLGMFLWSWSLSTGFASLVAQTQMIQPFLSLLAAAVLLHEAVEPELLWVMLGVLGCVAVSTYGRLRAPVLCRC